MYETKSQSLKAFVEDESIKLPRFQRKLTWNKKKNFYLAVSVIKNYPLGVTILRVEQDSKAKLTSKWLLDGRQRRFALAQMLTDPVQIYEWAKSALGIKGIDNSAKIKDKFREKIEEYIEYEPDSEQEQNFNLELEGEEENEDIETVVDVLEEFQQNFTPEFNPIEELEFLLKIIIIAHNGKNGNHTGITAPFVELSTFTNKKPSYFENGNKINPKKLRDFIENYKKFCAYESSNYKDKEEFKRFFKKETQFKDELSSKFSVVIDQSWNDELLEIILIYTRLNDIFSNSSIGTIEIRDIKDRDAQKIFNLINTGGTKLTAAEILAARPIWNRLIKNPSNELIEATKSLYKDKTMQIPEGVTVWDAAATFLLRIKNIDLFFNNSNFSGESGVAKKITISFKLLSAIVTKGIKKEDIDVKLSITTEWIEKIDEYVSDLNTMISLIKESVYFSTFSTWDKSLSTLIGDSPTIFFLAQTYQDWISKGKPLSNSLAVKFKKNAFILIDKLFYEFITRQWRGSSDSKVSKNLLSYTSTLELYDTLDKSYWQTLLNEMFYKFKIGNEEITYSESWKILYHYYSIKNIKGPDDENIKVEVDHIFPQTLIDESSLPDKKKIKDAPFNLALLPKKNNVIKGRKRLIEISTNTELVELILKYEEVEKSNFAEFSDLNNWQKLQDLRYEKFMETFDTSRDSLLNN